MIKSETATIKLLEIAKITSFMDVKAMKAAVIAKIVSQLTTKPIQVIQSRKKLFPKLDNTNKISRIITKIK